jgi:DNA mismatch repair protein MutS2
MQLYPKDIFERLEFSKILALMEKECMGEKATGYFLQPVIHSDRNAILTLLKEVEEWMRFTESGSSVPLGNYDSVHEFIPLLKKDGYVLDVESIQKIHRILRLAQDVNSFFTDEEKREAAPKIYACIAHLQLPAQLIAEIDRVFDKDGDVRPNASDELMKITKSIKNREREVEKVFRQEFGMYKARGFLAESGESISNGRLVLMVAAEHKRKIQGIIHDESATGKTVFIEPDACLHINNEVSSLYAERRAEIYRIIRALCQVIRPFADDILEAENVVVKLDTIRAKAMVGKMLHAVRPKLGSKARLALKTAKNPVLYLKNSELGLPVVPFDMELFGLNKILLLSGPNAGGKSVTMKTVGLLQLMLQFGMPVSCSVDSEFGIYHKIFVDIGDQQSVEDDLSTYSSHLQNMKHMLDEADEKTLLLIDEFGSGTDPKIGGAIAEAILENLRKKSVSGVITTHYSNLKYYAFKSQGLVNGAMEFDKASLNPTFQLKIGKPGSSFAFEIAQKSGFPESVLNYARKKTGQNEKAIDELLVNLQAERIELEGKMAQIVAKQDKLDKLLSTYDQLHLELEIKRKKLKLEQKEWKVRRSVNEQKEIEKIARELRKQENVKRVEELLQQKKEETKKIEEEIKEVKREVYVKTGQSKIQLKRGDFARIRDNDSIGEVVSVDKNMVKLQMGILTVQVPMTDLVSASEPIQTNQKKSVNYYGSGNDEKFESKIDLRGYLKDDAMNMLQDFLDRAMMSNAFELQIVHGIGNGKMKKYVHDKLKEYKDIKKSWHPEHEQGGEGVTLVSL